MIDEESVGGIWVNIYAALPFVLRAGDESDFERASSSFFIFIHICTI